MFPTKEVCQLLCLKIMAYLLKTDMRARESSRRIISNTGSRNDYLQWVYLKYFPHFTVKFISIYTIFHNDISRYTYKTLLIIIQIFHGVR